MEEYPKEIEELIDIIKDDNVNDSKSIKLIAIATYYNYHLICKLAKNVNLLKWMLGSIIILLIVELIKV